MSLRWTLWSLASPSQLLFAVTLAGALLQYFTRGTASPPTRWARLGRRLTLAGGAGLLIFGLLPTAHLLALPLENRFAGPELPPDVAGVVLLSGAERPRASQVYGEPQLSSAAGRYTATLRLAHRFPAARIVYSGGPTNDPVTGDPAQTAVARELLRTTGIGPGRVTFDERSVDTCSNAVGSRALADPRGGEIWVLVTSAIHMPRAVACFRAAGWPDIVPYPADHGALPLEWGIGAFQVADNLALLDDALHEWVGLVYYRLSGRTRELLPAP